LPVSSRISTLCLGSGLLMVGELMIPFARKICVDIDPANKRIAVELPEGLKDLNRP